MLSYFDSVIFVTTAIPEEEMRRPVFHKKRKTCATPGPRIIV